MKKGFVLLETLIVLIVAVVSMLGLFLTYSFVFKNLKLGNHYDNVNDVYKLNMFYKVLKDRSQKPSLGDASFAVITSSNCASYFDSNCSKLYTKTGFEKIIYTNANLNDILNNPLRLNNTDIDYIRKLEHNYSYLIGVYKKDNENYYVSLKVSDLE